MNSSFVWISSIAATYDIPCTYPISGLYIVNAYRILDKGFYNTVISSKYANVLGISVSIIKIDFSLVFAFECKGISILNLPLSFISFFKTGSSGFSYIISGTFSPLSISNCSRAEWSLSNCFKTEPRSAMISNRFLVIALRFPNARNHTLPLICSGIPSIHISRTRLLLLTLSQFGKISSDHTLIIFFILTYFYHSSRSRFVYSAYFSRFFFKYSYLSRSTIICTRDASSLD